MPTTQHRKGMHVETFPPHPLFLFFERVAVSITSFRFGEKASRVCLSLEPRTGYPSRWVEGGEEIRRIFLIGQLADVSCADQRKKITNGTNRAVLGRRQTFPSPSLDELSYRGDEPAPRKSKLSHLNAAPRQRGLFVLLEPGGKGEEGIFTPPTWAFLSFSSFASISSVLLFIRRAVFSSEVSCSLSFFCSF